MPTANDARWALRGEAIVAVARRQRRLSSLPEGLRRLPGPALVIAERFDESPVGPFVSLVVAEPVRLGSRPGYFFGICAVNNANARKLARQYWGFPYDLGALRWESDAHSRRLTWDERGLSISASAGMLRWPLLLPARAMQRRRDGLVVVPSRVRAMARKSRVEIETAEDDPLSALAGVHRGVVLDGLLLRRNPARRPLGAFSTLRAPLRAPEPGIIGMDAPKVPVLHRARIQLPTSRAYSSVG